MHYTHREVRYHEDMASLFAHVGGLDAEDSVLLESADITTRNGLQSVAVLRASVRVTCTGNRVTVEPLTPSGEVITADLGLEEYRVGEGVYEFPASRAADERERLTAPSSADVLRALTTRAGYGNEDFPFLAGGFAYDYLDSFEPLPSVEVGPNTYPDFQFVLAEVLLRINHEASTAYLAGVDAHGEGIDLEPLASLIDAPVPAYEPTTGEAERTVVKATVPDADFRADVEGLKAHIAGAAKAFLAAGRPFPVTGKGIMDTAGTGGDGANTINITTAASLIAAAGGVKMIKCGNRSVSSKSGSADVLEALNILLDLDPQRAVRQFESSNFTFLFAPAYNPAIAFVQLVRKKLGVSTLFNTMGPLLSPERPEFQIMGIANHKLGPLLRRP